MRFVVYEVADFRPWEDGEVAELEEQNRSYRGRQRVRRWDQVAAVSVRAVEANPGREWDFDSWCAFGTASGLSGADLGAFESLYVWALDVSPDDWINGRHRGLLIQESAAPQVAVVDPTWTPFDDDPE